MKKYLLSFLALVVVVVMASCGSNTPKDVANTWLNGFYHMDYEAAKKVSTEDTRNMISQIQQLAGKVNDSVKKEMRTIKIDIKKVDVKGDTARVTYRLSTQSRDMPLDVVKIDGKWLVVFTKSSRYMPPAEGEETPAAEVDTTGAATTPPDNTTAEDTTKN